MSFVIEREKKVPVVYDVDVVVAGGGISGLFAALAAARNGARTVLIDRFGAVGGNIGPGLFAFLERPGSPRLRHGVAGLPGEFINRVESLRGLGKGERWWFSLPSEYPFESETVSYVAFKMLEEAGVELMLSTYVAGAIMDGNMVRGVLVENKSGRQAVKAKETVDATGEADVAASAGAPLRWPKGRVGIGLAFCVGGVDWEKYEKYREEHSEPSEEDLRWSKEVLEVELGYSWGGYPKDLLPIIRKAWESGEYRIVQSVDGSAKVVMRPLGIHGPCVTTAETEGGSRFPDPANGTHISKLEARLRVYVYETVQFLRRYAPSFEKAFLQKTAPFLGARHGRCIEGEYVLTNEDVRACRRFDDVVYVYNDLKIREGCCDFPYRVMLPKKIEGLLAAGRSAHTGAPNLRARICCMYTGQAAGTAAAQAVRKGLTPRSINTKELQRTLVKQGVYLGDKARLKELGLN